MTWIIAAAIACLYFGLLALVWSLVLVASRADDEAERLHRDRIE